LHGEGPGPVLRTDGGAPRARRPGAVGVLRRGRRGRRARSSAGRRAGLDMSVLAVADVPFTSCQVPLDEVVLGVVTGLTYALLAVGLVLVYKTSRVLNFAHGEMGALAAGLMPWLVIRKGFPYWAAFTVAMVVAAA